LTAGSVFPRVDDDKTPPCCFGSQEVTGTWSTASSIAACGVDWIVENGNEADVVEICELPTPRATRSRPLGCWRFPDESTVQRRRIWPAGSSHGAGHVTRKYFASRGVKVERGIFLGHDGDQGRLLDGIVERPNRQAAFAPQSARVDTLLESTIRS